MHKKSMAREGKSQKSKQQLKGKDAPFPLRAPESGSDQMDYEIINFTTIFQGNSGPMSPIQAVINSADKLALVLGNNKAPTLDFSKEQAVVVALGEKPTNGFIVEITAMTYLTDRGGNLPPLLLVTYVIKTGKRSSDVITHPFHAVKLKKLDGDVEFSSKIP